MLTGWASNGAGVRNGENKKEFNRRKMMVQGRGAVGRSKGMFVVTSCSAQLMMWVTPSSSM